jgi:O-antigen/teichoic acid export membrane protein
LERRARLEPLRDKYRNILITSIRSRYAFSLSSNLIKALVSFSTGALIARGLGPDQYGKMMFLLGTFTALRQLFDFGCSMTFFTLLSARQRSWRFVGWYLAWIGVQFLVPLLAVAILLPSTWVDLIWHGEQRSLVIMALLAAYLQYTLWTTIAQMGESQRLTQWVYALSVAVAIFHFLLVAIFWWQEWLDASLILFAVASEWALATVVMVKQLRFPNQTDENYKLRSMFKEFAPYCLPMIPVACFSFVYEFSDRWLLQRYGGSVQQALYAVASQFGLIASLATSSILNIFWKEIAESNDRGERERVIELYRKVSRFLFFVAASIAGFLIPWATDILYLIMGLAYLGGSGAVMLMLLYSVHQNVGAICSVILFATGQVRIQAVVSMVFMASSILTAYFVLATPDEPIPGLGLGSTGLAGKMVIMQLISTNVFALYVARVLRIRFDWIYQPISGLGCIGIGYLSFAATHLLFNVQENIIIGFIVSALIYGFMITVLFWNIPSLIGSNKKELMNLLR